MSRKEDGRHSAMLVLSEEVHAAFFVGVGRCLGDRMEVPNLADESARVSYQQSHRLGISMPEAIKKKLFDQKGGTKTGRLAKDLLDLKESALRTSAAGFEAINRLLERAEAEAV